MGHGALDEDRAHDSEQGQPYAEEEGDASDKAKGRHLTNPNTITDKLYYTKSYRMRNAARPHGCVATTTGPA